MRVRSILFVLPLLVAGCGGGGGFSNNSNSDCSTDITYTPRSYYVGSFKGAFTPSTGTAVAEDFTFAVASDGTATGTLDDGSGTTLTVTGTAADYANGCVDSQVAIVLKFTPTGGTERTLTVYKQRNGSLPGLYAGILTDPSGTPTRGNLTVSTSS